MDNKYTAEVRAGRGMSVEEIASSMGITTDEVNKLLGKVKNDNTSKESSEATRKAIQH